jgi:lysyl-tRNA synthetase, class I
MNKDQNQSNWAEKAADEVLEKFPDLEVYTCAAGGSPSGKIHFGNFRDVMTAYAVYEELKKRGKNARMIFSWDNFDRFRKVPVGIDESYEQYIGIPYTKIPAPDGTSESYGKQYQNEYEKTMSDIGLDIEFIDQTEQYESGRYDDQIILALKKRKEIADILLSFMSEKGKERSGVVDEEYRENYYPVSVFSEFSGKDNTKVLSYDGDESITYKCFDTDQESTINIRDKHIVKLGWKIDWPMRWVVEKVAFEPAGHDHASPGGSIDVGAVMVKDIFESTNPVYKEYKFVGIQGLDGKMSGSKGNAVTPAELLEIYTPELLKWLYTRKAPHQTFSLAFDSEIYRQYSEFDTEHVDENSEVKPIPFRQAVAFGQIVQWDTEKINEIIKALDLSYSKESIEERFPKAKAWLETYNPEELITLSENVNSEYVSQMNDAQKGYISDLKEYLEANENAEIKQIEEKVYAIPKDESLDQKENAPLQRAFFKDVYNLLIASNKGPRLSTFLWAVDRKKVIELLNI